MPAYLDYAATTPVDKEVLDVFIKTTNEVWGNPSGSHRVSQKARAALEKARLKIANNLNVRSTELYFTSSATEANNIVIQGVINKNINKKKRVHVLISALEHSSVSEFVTFPNIDVEVYSVCSDGIVSVDDIISRILPETCLICLMLVSNEIGTIQPVHELVKRINDINNIRKEIDLPHIYIHSDCVQAPLYLSLDLHSLGVDSAVISGHKLYAPRGGALAYIKDSTELVKIFYGGGQERDLRSGTQNVSAVCALAKALNLAYSNREERVKHVRELRDYLIAFLTKDIPYIIINGSMINRIPNNLHVTIPNIDEEKLLIKLDLLGFSVSAGSSCTSGAHKKSRISKILHPDAVGADLRITLGKDNTYQQIVSFCLAVKEIVTDLSKV